MVRFLYRRYYKDGKKEGKHFSMSMPIWPTPLYFIGKRKKEGFSTGGMTTVKLRCGDSHGGRRTDLAEDGMPMVS